METSMKNKINEHKLKAVPEEENFRGKYESGKIGNKLLDGYFKAINSLLSEVSIDKKNAKAIEIGCGEGLSTKRINDLLSDNIVLEGSEYVEHQIPFAKKNNPGMKITKESIYELTHKNDTFNLVFLPEVLEHLDYPEEGLIELYRITKKEGYLIIGVPNEPLWRILNMMRGKYLKDFGNTPGHLNNWSKRGVIKLVEKHYGEVISTRSPLPWTILLAKKK
jgi:SAM-dependent methyltransferase